MHVQCCHAVVIGLYGGRTYNHLLRCQFFQPTVGTYLDYLQRNKLCISKFCSLSLPTNLPPKLIASAARWFVCYSWRQSLLIILINSNSSRRLKSYSNRCIKIFFGYSRRDSLTNILFNFGLPSFDTLLTNAVVTFARLCIDVKNVLEKIKNVKKCKKRGQNKKRLKTLNKKTLSLICLTSCLMRCLLL